MYDTETGTLSPANGLGGAGRRALVYREPAGKLNLELDDIAGLNLERIAERWPVEGEEQPARLLDNRFPSAE